MLITRQMIMYFFLGCFVNLIYVVLVSLRYKYLLHVLKERISLFHSACLSCVSHTINYIDPFNVGGMLVKPLMSKALSKTTVRNAFLVTLFEQLFDLLWQIPFLVIILVFLGKSFFAEFLSDIPYLEVIVIFLIACLGLLVVFYFNRIMDFVFDKLIPKKIKNIPAFKKEHFMGAKQELLLYMKDPKITSVMLLITGVSVLFAPFLIVASLLPFGIILNYSQVFLVYWISYIAGRLSGIPGGFGTRDAAMFGMLLHYGYSSAVILSAIVFYRLITFIPNLVIGGSLMIYYGSKYSINFFKK